MSSTYFVLHCEYAISFSVLCLQLEYFPVWQDPFQFLLHCVVYVVADHEVVVAVVSVSAVVVDVE